MTSLPLARLRPGMMLAAAVYNRQEVLLLKADTRLTDKHIKILKSWGIRQVGIRGSSDGARAENRQAPSSDAASLEAALQARCPGAADNPVMQTILRVAARQLQARAVRRDG